MERAIDQRRLEEQGEPNGGSVSGARSELRWRPIARFALAVVPAGALALGIHHLLPRSLSAHTDVVGYPLYADFNVNRYFDNYYLAALVFPALALVFCQFLGWIGPLRRPRPAPRERAGATVSPTVDASPARVVRLGAVLRTLLPGAATGLECAAAFDRNARGVVLVVVIGAVAYGVVVALVAFALARLGRPLARADVNAVLALVVLPLLSFVSDRTVVVLTSGRVVHYPWLPLWLTLVGVVVFGAVGVRLRRRRRWSAERTEWTLLATVVVPIVIFVVLASLPGNLGSMDAFGEGEYLAGGWLMLHGALPWRDLLQIHGVFDDGLKAILGFEVFGDSRWGASAGIAMFFLPAYWVSTYLFATWLFARRTGALVLSVLAVCCGVFVDWDPRYLFWPLVLVLFGAALRSSRRRTAFALGVVLVVQLVLIPEMSYALLSLGFALFAFECYVRPRGAWAISQFRKTAAALGGVVGSGLLFSIYLVATGSFSGFVGYFENFAAAHDITGGIPLFANYALPPTRSSLGIFRFITTQGGYFTRYTAELYLPIILLLATVLLVAWKVRSRRTLSVQNWTAIAAAGLVALYYQKGISRGDDFHIGSSFAVAVPLLLLVGYELFELSDAPVATLIARALARARRREDGERTPSRVLIRYPVSLAAMVVVAVLVPLNPVSVFEGAGARLQPSGAVAGPAPAVAGAPTLGYGGGAALPAHLVADLGTIFRTYAGPHGAIFDFSDAPAVVDYLLDRNPGSSYYDVSLAITAEAQQGAVNDLERSKPKLVLFNGEVGLPYWDYIENEVRQYVIARYVLDNYRPLVLVDGELVLIADSDRDPPSLPHLEGTPTTSGLYFSERTCAFGFIPSFLALPAGDATGHGTSVQPVEVANLGREGRYYRLELPRAPGNYGFVAVTRTGGAAPAALELTRGIERTRQQLPSEITWATTSAGRAALSVGSCLQWHGEAKTVYLRYIGPGQPVAVTFYS